jgi:hypothetical protein
MEEVVVPIEDSKEIEENHQRKILEEAPQKARRTRCKKASSS